MLRFSQPVLPCSLTARSPSAHALRGEEEASSTILKPINVSEIIKGENLYLEALNSPLPLPIASGFPLTVWPAHFFLALPWIKVALVGDPVLCFALQLCIGRIVMMQRAGKKWPNHLN